MYVSSYIVTVVTYKVIEKGLELKSLWKKTFQEWRNKICSPCLHSLVKTESRSVKTRDAQLKVFTYSRRFSTGYEGTDNMFYFLTPKPKYREWTFENIVGNINVFEQIRKTSLFSSCCWIIKQQIFIQTASDFHSKDSLKPKLAFVAAKKNKHDDVSRSGGRRFLF